MIQICGTWKEKLYVKQVSIITKQDEKKKGEGKRTTYAHDELLDPQ